MARQVVHLELLSVKESEQTNMVVGHFLGHLRANGAHANDHYLLTS